MAKRNSKINCCIIGCFNTYKNTKDVIFYSFPTRKTEVERREKWIQAVKRLKKHGIVWEPSRNSRICSQHFIGNRRSGHPHSPAYVPTIFPDERCLESYQAMERFNRIMKRRKTSALRHTSFETDTVNNNAYHFINVPTETDDKKKFVMSDENLIEHTEIDREQENLQNIKVEIEEEPLDFVFVKVENDMYEQHLELSGDHFTNNHFDQSLVCNETTSVKEEINNVECEQGTQSMIQREVTDASYNTIKIEKTTDKGGDYRSLSKSNSQLDRRHVCKTCGEVFISKSGLCSHISRHCMKYPCNTCGKTFMSEHLRDEHAMFHKVEYTCESCGKSFVSKKYLDDHMLVHCVKYICEICGKTYISKRCFREHLSLHNTVRNYQCFVCQRYYVSKHILKKHLHIHTGEKKYVCDFCGKNFRTKSDIVLHMPYHSKQKKYSCDKCGKSYYTKCGLIPHVTTHDGQVRCGMCGKMYGSRSSLSVHMSYHENANNLMCTLCNKSYTNTRSFKGHLICYSGTVQPMCRNCKTYFPSQCQLSQHLKLHYG